MYSSLLDPRYEGRFIDTPAYQEATIFLMRGLASVIQECHPTWRPTLSELVALIGSEPKAISDPLVLSCSAYAAGNQIRDSFPGPAILLFAAALNGLGSKPQTELKKSIRRAKLKLCPQRLKRDPDIQVLFQAAHERAEMDRVRAMLEEEFSYGLIRSGKFTKERIERAIPELIITANRVRHEGLVDRFGWTPVFPNNHSGEYYDEEEVIQDYGSTGVIFLNEHGDELQYGISFLQYLVPYAKFGSAFSIFKRIEMLDGFPG